MLFKKWAAFLFSFSLFAEQKLCFELDKLDELNVVEPFVLDKLSYSSNINLDAKEFRYLVDLKEGELVDATALKNSCFYLKQKNKFKKICLTINDKPESSTYKQLHFDLHGCWTFDCLAISGILVGKDPIMQMYRLEHGDPFDLEKHNHSVQDIKKHFMAEGYFDVQVVEQFENDRKYRSVKVGLKIKKGPRFVVDSVNFKFSSAGQGCEADKLKAKIKETFTKRFCKSYSIEKISKVKNQLKNYLSQIGFSLSVLEIEEETKRAHKSVSLTVKIYLNKKVECFFSGNKTFSSKLLMDSLLNLVHTVSGLPIILLEEELCKFYKSKGFWNVAIESQKTKNGYYFYINEGDRISISKVAFCDQSYFRSERLAKFFNRVVNKNYSTDLIEDSIANLISYYIKNGFLDVQISNKLIPLEIENQFCLEVTVQEGARYILKSVRVNDFVALDKAILFRTKLYAAYDPSILVEQKKMISDYLSLHGYRTSNVSPAISYQEEGNEKYVLINWEIEKVKQQDKFGKAMVFGSTNYSFTRILRELCFKPNELWDRDKLYDSFLRLRRLNAFENVRVYPHSEKDMFGRRPVYIKLYPSNKFEFKTRLGFQQVSKNLTFRGRSTYKLGASFEWNSPFLLGDKLNLETDFTLFYRRVVASYRMPWVQNFPYQTLFQAYNNKYQQPLYIGSKKNLYEVKQYGFLTSFEDKKKFTSSAFSMGAEKMRISKLSKEVADAIKFSSNVVGKSIPYFFVEPSLFMDYLDDKINPTRGFFSLISCKGMISSCHNFDFFKVFGEHAFFIPILKPLVLATRIRLGHIFIKDFTQLFPSERFYLGGSNSLRGYFPDFAPPLGCFDCNGKPEQAPIGGSSIWNINLEIRFPLYKNFGLVFFNDMGGLANPFNEMNFLYAVGTGVRYFTPVGPLRLDLAWAPETSKKKSSIMWFFTFGHSF